MNIRHSLTILLLLVAQAAMAQAGLHVAQLFEGKIVDRKQMVEVKVRGKALAKYNLSFYHSVRFKPTDSQLSATQTLVDKDRQAALSVEEMHRSGNYIAIVSLASKGSQHRYLCHLVTKQGRQTYVTLIYMEGQVATIDDLRKLISK